VEVVAKAERRRFTAEYKRRIVREADRCTKPGEIGALLRREGLYSSHLVTWRAARDRGELEGLSPKKRGPKVAPPDPRDRKIAELEREVGRQTKRAERLHGPRALGDGTQPGVVLGHHQAARNRHILRSFSGR
jgi:transposase